MKHIKKVIALLAIIGIFQITYSENLGVDEIKVIDANTISVMLSDNPNLKQGEIEGEVTILNDVSLRGAISSDIGLNSVELMLEDPVLPNTSYSLLTISGADGSIDFRTGENVEGFKASNISLAGEQDIDSIEILDDRTIIISYKGDVSASSYEYKLLAESNIVKIEKPDYFTPELIISLKPPLLSNKDYILMFIDLPDAEGNYIEFDTGIYDFSTQEIISPKDTNNETETEEILINEAILLGENSQGENLDEIDLEAAGDEDMISLEKDAMIDTREAATLLTETPDTGASTWVLILATLLINTFYYLSRRKSRLHIA